MQHIKILSFLLTVTAIAVILLSGCSATSINQDYDPDYDFSQLKTFGFLPIPAESGIDQINADRLNKAITTNLTQKGFTASNEADFGIAIMFSTETKTDINSYGYGYGYGGYWGRGNIDVNQYEEGTLIIDFIDVEKKELIWRGYGTRALSSNPSVEQRIENINNAVAKILSQFPPNKVE